MKIGVVGDVHSNIYAFSAELDALKKEGAQMILCTGDLVGIGPFPEETVRLAMETPGFTCVKGNHEIRLFSGTEGLSQPELAHHKWKLSRLSGASIDYLKNLPMSCKLSLGGRDIQMIHYPFDGEKFRKVAENAESREFFETFKDFGGDLLLFGHDHKRSVLEKGGRLFVNFGSCGCPHEDAGIARGGILELSGGEVRWQDVCAEYDLRAVIDEIDRLKYADFSYIKRVFYGQK